MQPKWIALGLFLAGLCLILGAGIPQLKHVAIGSAASTAAMTANPDLGVSRSCASGSDALSAE